MTYHLLHKFGIERKELGGGRCGSILNVIDERAGYFRNDSIHKKVWYQNPSININHDTLLYDFSLSVGDTLGVYNQAKVYLNGNVKIIKVDSIDTLIHNRTERKRLILNDTDFYFSIPLILIEGVGSNIGLLHNTFIDMWAPNSLYCLSSKGRTIYPDSTTSCNLVTGIGEQNFKKEKTFEIYPNPTNGKVVLQSKIKFQKIKVYNLQGQKVQEINPNEKSWELPHQNGVYLIGLQDKKGRNYTEKVLKK